MRARLVTLGIALLLLSALVSAQTGQIAGTVRDTSGGVLPGVLVEVSSPALVEKVRSTTTDNSGRYQITALPAGTYTVTFSLAGFTTVRRENVAITSGFTAPVNAEMQVGALTETIRVVGDPPAVDVQSARQATVDGQAPGVPPTARDVSGLLHLTPGIAGQGAGGAVGYAGRPFAHRPDPRGRESYAAIAENAFHHVADAPLSTFSIDVDTASYANVRRFLNAGELPPPDAVRVEELINYFHFDYPQPKGDVPFSVTTELVESPWNPRYRLALIGLQGRETFDEGRTPRNLVFLLDVSGSMQPEDKLPLVRNGMRMLVDTLQPRDRVAIVTYAGASGVALPSTAGDRKAEIHAAIERLHAGGSTNGAAGIRLAYQIARAQFVAGGVNRVILATDGDFNVGVTSHDELLRLIEDERRSGIFLSVLGVGTGNIQDDRMEMLADKGNGNYAYLDSLQEARKVLVNEASSTLVTIAKDVKIQIEFNPQTVAAYRLVGYENRLLKAEDFNDDRKDAGEIGAGHSVTALYEIVPAGEAVPNPTVDPLKYQPPAAPVPRVTPVNGAYADELMTVKLRYKAPDGDTSRLVTSVIRTKPQAMTANVGFASAVAEFGLMLRGSAHVPAADFAPLAARARRFRGPDPDGYRAEFVRLVELASGLRTLQTRR
jgi:Ca-activated chloride channel family protein